jgi:uncharacterized protein
MHTITSPEYSRIAQDLQLRKVQIENVAQLLGDGNTIPFIARYRKERTGGLSEDLLRQIRNRLSFFHQLHERKQTILKSIETQGRLIEELRGAILSADTNKRLDDLYLPFMAKKKGLAAAARERGLEPLAMAIWHGDPAAAGSVDELFAALVNPEHQLNSADDVRQGVLHILADLISENADARAAARRVLWQTGKIVASKSEKLPEGQGLDYKDYFQFTEPARQIPPHRILALNRGEKEGAIRVKVEWHKEKLHDAALAALADRLSAVAGKIPASPASASPSAPPAVVAPASEGAPSPTESPSPIEPAPSLETPMPTEPVASAPEASVAPVAEAPAPAPPVEATAVPLVAQLTLPVEPPTREGEPLCPTGVFRSPHAGLLRAAFEDALTRLVMPSLEREVRHELTEEAVGHAVSVFARNLRGLLLQPPLRGRRVLAIDPGFRTGCRIAALDESGNLLEHLAAYPFGGGPRRGPREKKGEATKKDAPRPAETSATESPSPTVPTPEGSASSTDSSAPSPAESLKTCRPPTEADAAPVADPGIAAPAPPEPTESSPTATEEPSTAHDAASSGPSAESETPPAGESPTSPAAPDRRAEAKARIQELATRHGLTVIAVGNGSGSREAEELIAELISSALPDLSYVVVNEAGASVYAVSQIGREELPGCDSATRSAISIGRRLQEPLRELVKIDPHSIGVGLYQHDMGRRELKESLEAVVESSVNLVGVDVNTASVPLLRHVAGLNQLVARDLVTYRKQHGPFASREQLLQPLGPVRFTQAAGFLKVPGSTNPLDESSIHPECYGLAENLLKELGFGLDALRDAGRQQEVHAKLAAASEADLAQKLGAGEATIADLLDALRKFGRDPRDELPPPIFKKGILRLEDLQAGMELKGTVLNVVDFGAFIDVGLKDSGLVHISQMANRYIKSPYDVVAVNDVVTVWVLNVDKDRHRVSLSMIKPGTPRRAAEGRPAPPRPPRGPRPPQAPRGQPREATAAGQPSGAGDRHRGRPPRGRPPTGAPRPAEPASASASPPGAPVPAAKPAAPPPPPRKPRRPLPRPKLTQEAIEGKVPLRTFGELSALFAAKREESRPSKPEEAPPAAGEAQSVHAAAVVATDPASEEPSPPSAAAVPEPAAPPQPDNAGTVS